MNFIVVLEPSRQQSDYGLSIRQDRQPSIIAFEGFDECLRDAVGFWRADWRETKLHNRQRKANGKPPVNGKRVLRIMQVNKLTLERHTGRRPGRTHDGVVIALRSNIRWCSDHFELACRNGEIVRVLFAIDACDREVMAWLATSAGISGEMVRDLMIACVECRFGISKAAHPGRGRKP